MIIDAAELDAAHAYKLLIGSIIARAVVWVSTVSREGVANLAPVSFWCYGRPRKLSTAMRAERATGRL